MRIDDIDAVEPVEPTAAGTDRHERPVLVRRAGTSADERVTAQLHVDALEGMFVRFGVGFVRSYHASFRRSPHAVSYAVEGPDGIVGFLVGTIENEAHYRWLARRASPTLVPRAVLALLRRPRVALDAIRTRRRRYLRALLRRLRPRRRPADGPSVAAADHPTTEPGPPRVGVLTHVAVDASARGTGAGRQLVEAYEGTLRTAGVTEARLITAPGGGAPAFYRRLGWVGAGVRTGADGTEVEEFIRTW